MSVAVATAKSDQSGVYEREDLLNGCQAVAQGVCLADVDVIAAYLVPKDLWYIVPIEECTCKNLWFFPEKSIKGSRFEKFREAWDYLRAPPATDVTAPFADEVRSPEIPMIVSEESPPSTLRRP